MHFQRTLNRFSRENVPGYLAVFIGGFGDMFAGCLSRVEKDFPVFAGCGVRNGLLPLGRRRLRRVFDRCGKIAVELEELRRRYPGLPVVLIGHSYGGSCAVEVARRQSVQAAPLCLLTVDAVARRQKSVRPACVEWWGNAYLRDGGGFMDAVPRIGGRWGHCAGADANLAFPATVVTGRAAFILTGVLRPCFMSRLGKKHAAFSSRCLLAGKKSSGLNCRSRATSSVHPTSPVGKEVG